MRVALVYPEVYDLARFKEKRKEFPPFGVLYLASVAEQAGHDVTVFKVTDQDWQLDLTGSRRSGSASRPRPRTGSSRTPGWTAPTTTTR